MDISKELGNAGLTGTAELEAARITDAECEGFRQRRVSEIPVANICIETIVSPEVADRLLEVIST